MNLLTPREKEIAQAVARGYTNLEIATRLHLAEGTVKRNLSRVFVKMRVRNRTELTLRLVKAGR